MTSKRFSPGFTLLELVLAMLISSLVMGILSVALGFSLRVWERQFDRKTSDMPAMIDLLKWQLASMNPAPVQSEGQSRVVFEGKEHSLTFATDVSVRALSHGVPVVARYLYKPSEKLLYYAEIPFDPYHPEPIEQFMKLEPGKKKTWPVFQATDAFRVAFSYGGAEGGMEKQWSDEKEVPAVVDVLWSEREDEKRTTVIAPNSFFPRESQQDAAQTGIGGKRKRQ